MSSYQNWATEKSKDTVEFPVMFLLKPIANWPSLLCGACNSVNFLI